MLNAVEADITAGEEPTLEPLLIEACGNLLADTSLDPAMVAEMRGVFEGEIVVGEDLLTLEI